MGFSFLDSLSACSTRACSSLRPIVCRRQPFYVEKRVADITCFFFAPHCPAGGQRRGRLSGILLEVNSRARCEPLPAVEKGEEPFRKLSAERRVQEYDIHGRRYCMAKMLQSIAAHDRGRCRTEMPGALSQRIARFAASLDEDGRRRAPRQRFEAEHAGSREQVEAARTFDFGCQPVENRFANSLGGRSKLRYVGDRQKTTAPFSRYNTHAARPRRGRRPGTGWSSRHGFRI